MSAGTSAVKTTAKTALKDNWAKVVVACFIYICVIFICSYTTELLSIVTGNLIAEAVLTVLTLFLSLPLFMGLVRFVWRMLFSVCDNPIEIFYWFSSTKLYFKVLKFVLILAIRAILWLLLLNIPTFCLQILTNNQIFEFFDIAMPLWAANLTNIAKIFSICASVGTLFLMLKYYLAPILFVSDENMDVGEAIHMSKVISKRSSVDLIYLGFSMFHWILLSFLAVPAILTIPYILTCYAVHSRFAISEYNRYINEIAQKDFGYFSPGI